MKIEFADAQLRRLYTERGYNAAYSTEVIRSFRKKARFIASARDERDLRNWSSLDYHRLRGDRKHQWAIRLNGNWRLILERRERAGCLTLVLVGIEDYH